MIAIYDEYLNSQANYEANGKAVNGASSESLKNSHPKEHDKPSSKKSSIHTLNENNTFNSNKTSKHRYSKFTYI